MQSGHCFLEVEFPRSFSRHRTQPLQQWPIATQLVQNVGHIYDDLVFGPPQGLYHASAATIHNVSRPTTVGAHHRQPMRQRLQHHHSARVPQARKQQSVMLVVKLVELFVGLPCQPSNVVRHPKHCCHLLQTLARWSVSHNCEPCQHTAIAQKPHGLKSQVEALPFQKTANIEESQSSIRLIAFLVCP